MANILLYTEQRGGEFKSATLPAVTFARQLAEKVGGGFDIVVLGHNVGGVVEQVKGLGAAKVLVADSANLAHPLPDVYAAALAEVAQKSGAKYVVASATTIAKDFMPRVAARLGAGMVSEAVGVVGPKAFKRLMWAGNVVAQVEVATDVVVATVRGAEFEKAQPTGGASPVEAVSVSAAPNACTFVKFAETKSERPPLAEANVVVSGGRGLKSRENFDKLLGPLCDALNAAMGATRAVVDAGFVDNDLQVGQTGKIVAPDLYIAVGLSGAIQHLAGMKNSKTIVAINKDEEAPIFSVADYGLVEDLFKVLPEMIERIRAHKQSA